MTTLREAATQALEAMRRAVPTGEITLMDWMKANHDLEAALAEHDKNLAWFKERKANWDLQRKLAEEPQERDRLRQEEALQRFTDVNQELEAALADLSHCPQCGGPADNGHDRSIPPSPYFCTKCMAEPYDQTALELCNVCGWKTLIPGDCCLNCERKHPLGQASTDVLLTVYSVKKAEPDVPETNFGNMEPVALDWLHKWANQDDGEPETQWHEGYEAARRVVQIHLTAPPQRKPLTEEEIQELSEQHKFDSRMEKFVRIIERAHGIK
jgi:hypothetical protein